MGKGIAVAHRLVRKAIDLIGTEKKAVFNRGFWRFRHFLNSDLLPQLFEKQEATTHNFTMHT